MHKRSEFINGQRVGWHAEIAWLIAEVAALVVLFLIAFLGRDYFGDEVKSWLTALSAVAGFLGIVEGSVIVARGLMERSTLRWRLPLAALMMFLGGYTMVHVLS